MIVMIVMNNTLSIMIGYPIEKVKKNIDHYLSNEKGVHENMRSVFFYLYNYFL